MADDKLFADNPFAIEWYNAAKALETNRVPKEEAVRTDQAMTIDPVNAHLRVAVYNRSATPDGNHLVDYREMIEANPNWKYVGEYSDIGYSGSKTDDRPAFNKMIADIMAGKIDLVIMPSMDRIARNMNICLDFLRRLKEHEPSVNVFFEKQGICSLDLFDATYVAKQIDKLLESDET